MLDSTSLKKAALFTLFLVIAFVVSWEVYLRNSGNDHAFDDGGPLWSHHRSMVYEPMDESTIFIGSSRIKFDLDHDTWQSVTGDNQVQLSCVGSTPLPVLYDLADDPDFKGKLIIDVTEPLFFSPAPFASASPKKYVQYYHDITPTQRASFWINKPVENTFVFLDKDNYSINALLDKLQIKSRPGVFMFPIFPRDFERNRFDRQCYMKPEFVADTNQHNQVRAIWGILVMGDKTPPITGAPLDSLLETVKAATDKIKARGGKIVFVRTPSSGPFLTGEQMVFPREKYWDRLLAFTGTKGIHFMDDPATDHYICPEFSHLTPADAVDYTKHLIRTLQTDHNWQFPDMNKM